MRINMNEKHIKSSLSEKQGKSVNESFKETVFNRQEDVALPRENRFQLSFQNYSLLLLFRVLSCISPQLGYIHPDEFFQTVEVIGGDMFEFRTARPWEFNSTFPIRTIVLPYITTGIPLAFLKKFDGLSRSIFDINLLTPYGILISVRLAMCLLSFVSDACLYKICKMYNYKFINHYLMIFASSYVVAVYSTRTFSNTIEMCLFSILLYLVAKCMREQNYNIDIRSYFNKQYLNSRSITERVKFMKMLKGVPNCDLRHCFLISSLTVVGCFNRPTFAAFAVGPVFFWLHRGLGSQFVNFRIIHYRVLCFLLSALPVLILFILIDSFYYGYTSFAEIQQGEFSIDSLVVTPLNFLRYNLDPKNLAQHGLHSRYIHVLVNIPLLYSLLAFVAYTSVASAVWRFVRRRKLSKTHVFSLRSLMFVSVAAPIFTLSLFPHQEPRFLVPLILPMVFLYSYRLNKRNILIAWYGLNFIKVLFYGFIHQAGVVQLAPFITTELEECLPNCTVHVITSHMYMIPQVLLQQPSDEIKFSREGYAYQKVRRLFLYELGSTSLKQLYRKITFVQMKNNFHPNRAWDHRLYVVIPSIMKSDFEETLLDNDYDTRLNFHEAAVLFPHFSIEALLHTEPNENHNKTVKNFKYGYWNIISNSFKSVYYILELSVYRLEKSLCYKDNMRKTCIS